MKSNISWEESKNLCEQNGSKLVSMERLRAELNFLKNQSEALKMNTIEYYIGLRKNGQKWMWFSDKSTLEETKGDHFPWAPGEPMEIVSKCGSKTQAHGLTCMYMTTLTAQFLRLTLDISARETRHL